MRKLLLSLFCLLWALSCFGQVEIKDIVTEDFPKVSFTLKTYDPVVRTTEHIRIFEEDSLVPVSCFESLGAPSIPTAKNVLFLWDMNNDNNFFVPQLLYDFFHGMTLTSQTSDNLKANVAVFGGTETGDRFYMRLFSSFTTDLQRIGDSVSNTTPEKQTNIPKNKRQRGISSDIIQALDSAINQIKVQPVNEAKAIVLCTTGKNADSGYNIPDIVARAKENRVIIYVVNITGDESGEALCKNLSSRTYGLHLPTEGSDRTDVIRKRREENEKVKKENKEKRESKLLPNPFVFVESETINAWVNDLPQRWAGNTYKVTFDSQFAKTGQTKVIKVQFGDESASQSYTIPKYTFGNWIKDHLILFLILLVVLLAGVGTGLFFLIRYLRDRSADKRDEEKQLEEERERLKKEQESLKRKLDIAENERRERLEKEKAKEKAAQRQEQLDALNSLMRAKNIKARVLISTMTGSFEYIIGTAENTIGSAEDNDIVVEDKTVSRHHAILYFNGQTFGIRDLHSTNGIVMNGFKVDDLKLRNGDSVSLGNTVMKIYF